MEAGKGCPIRRLGVSKCGLSRLDGVVGFTTGLSPDCLVEIDLSSNTIFEVEEAECVRVMADALRGNWGLRKLWVGGKTLSMGAQAGLRELLSRVSQQGCQQLQVLTD